MMVRCFGFSIKIPFILREREREKGERAGIVGFPQQIDGGEVGSFK